MVSTGLVRLWNDHEWWGVIGSDATPGGCWASFAAVLVDGYRSLEEGQQVRFSFEAADQDGYAFRAVEVWPDEPDDGNRRRWDRRRGSL